jgi:hypothetical protein
MKELTISAAVMCYPARRNWADALAREISDLRPVVAEDPNPDDAPSTIRTALSAWEAIRADSSHHLVLQDDVLLAERFVQQTAAAAAQFPDCILALYSTWYTANGSAARLAALSDASWVEAVPGDYVPTPALVVPRNDVMQDRDGYALWLNTLLEHALGPTAATNVRIAFEDLPGGAVCRLDVQPGH